MAPGPDYHQNFVQHIMKYFKNVNIILVIILILTSYSYVFHFYLQSNASILAWSIFKKLIFKWKEDIKVIMALLIDIIWDYQTILNNVTDSKIPFTPLISTFYWRRTKGTWVIYCIDHLCVLSLKDNNFPFNLQQYKLSYSTNFSGRPPDKIYMWVLWNTIIEIMEIDFLIEFRVDLR